MKKMNVVIQTAFLGDLILSIPLFRKIKTLFPEHDLGVVCKKGLGAFLLSEKIVDQVFEVEKSNRSSYAAAIQVINAQSVQNVFCVHRSTRSLLMAAQIKAEKRIGFSSFLGFWIFDDNIDFLYEAPEAIRQYKILETSDTHIRELFLNNNFDRYNDVREIPPEEFSFRSVRTSSSKRVALFPGSVWNTKKWSEEGFKELAQILLNSGYEVDLLGGPDEKVLCESIANGDARIRVLAGSYSIAETIGHIKEYALVVSNDSAPTHMASYSGVPVVTIFGPTTSMMGFRPWAEKARVVENESMICRPCGPHGHQACPLGHHLCMKTITSAQVAAACRAFLPDL
jgi:heptosyltransferase II